MAVSVPAACSRRRLDRHLSATASSQQRRRRVTPDTWRADHAVTGWSSCRARRRSSGLQQVSAARPGQASGSLAEWLATTVVMETAVG